MQRDLERAQKEISDTREELKSKNNRFEEMKLDYEKKLFELSHSVKDKDLQLREIGLNHRQREEELIK